MTDAVYLGNPNLKKANVSQEWTKEEVKEYTKCMDNPQYFIETYVKIVSLDEGLIPFKMYSFQKCHYKNRFLQTPVETHRTSIRHHKTSIRQMGKTHILFKF